MAESKNSNHSDDVILFMIIALLMCAALAKYSDRLEAWFWNHIGFIVVMAIGAIYATVKFLQWRFKMKHPEVYERELALKQMQARNRQNF